MTFADVAAGKYTLQQIFDHVASNLLRQGEVCADDDGSCRFRSDGGKKKCAVGWVISDEEYSQIFRGAEEDGESLGKLIQCRRLPMPDNAIFDLLVDLQKMHDEWSPDNYLRSDRWMIDLEDVARFHGLTFNYGAS